MDPRAEGGRIGDAEGWGGGREGASRSLRTAPQFVGDSSYTLHSTRMHELVPGRVPAVHCRGGAAVWHASSGPGFKPGTTSGILTGILFLS